MQSYSPARKGHARQISMQVNHWARRCESSRMSRRSLIFGLTYCRTSDLQSAKILAREVTIKSEKQENSSQKMKILGHESLNQQARKVLGLVLKIEVNEAIEDPREDMLVQVNHWREGGWAGGDEKPQDASSFNHEAKPSLRPAEPRLRQQVLQPRSWILKSILPTWNETRDPSSLGIILPAKWMVNPPKSKVWCLDIRLILPQIHEHQACKFRPFSKTIVTSLAKILADCKSDVLQ